ncbi:hypothetical protein [Streptomyces sp. LaBMicrA B280]|uniref:hypothetical protein n=1 Tax=Streptomyces sp. LaBMicrA B280 TaxID=3391001 RepID=UPI003BA71497
MRTLQADGRDDRKLGSGVAGTAGQNVSGLETKAMARLGVALQGESDGEIGVLAVGTDGAEAGGGDGRGAVLGQVGVLGQEPEWVDVEVAALNDYTPDVPSKIDGMGDSGLWTHASAAATGQFHTSSQKTGDGDLIVKWSDGEVTLYPGDQAQGLYTGCAKDHRARCSSPSRTR